MATSQETIGNVFKYGKYEHLHIPPDIPRKGTLLYFPVQPETSEIAFHTLIMRRGTMTMYYPSTAQHPVEASILFNTYPEITKDDYRKREPRPGNGTIQYKVHGLLNDESPVPYNQKMNLLYEGDTVAVFRREYQLMVEITKRTIPFYLLLGAGDSMFTNFKVNDSPVQLNIRDFSGQMRDGAPSPYCRVSFSEEDRYNLHRNRTTLTWMGLHAPICTVQFVTPPQGIIESPKK